MSCVSYSSVDVYIDGVAYAMSQFNSSHYTYSINAAEDHYYFIRALTSSGAYLTSSPMWSEAGGPPPDTEPPLITAAGPFSGDGFFWNLRQLRSCRAAGAPGCRRSGHMAVQRAPCTPILLPGLRCL